MKNKMNTNITKGSWHPGKPHTGTNQPWQSVRKTAPQYTFKVKSDVEVLHETTLIKKSKFKFLPACTLWLEVK